jgi:molybdopterin molybdotransferase
MLSVAEAQAVILHHARPLAPASVALADALDLVLAEDVASDLDMPPFDKSMMDGYAVRVSDLPDGRGELSVTGEITAGMAPTVSLGRGQAIRIMTGAPIPTGTEAVVQIERTKPAADGRVEIDDPGLKSQQNILTRGREMRTGDVVLRAGLRLDPQAIGLLATVGRTSVTITPRPQVAVVPTGDEIVEPNHVPVAGQIRNGNGPMLLGQAARAGARPRYLGIARDRVESLGEKISAGLDADVLLLSGGVSAGKLDLVPGVLQDLGVEAHFHKIEMKPGKPLFFGTRAGTLVFGLPGNPVSSFVCFELFVRPALRILRGLSDPGTKLPEAVLIQDFAYRTDRPTYHPARLDPAPTGWRVQPAAWFGSPDLRGLLHCNCCVLFPAGDHRHSAGQRFPVLRLDDCG